MKKFLLSATVLFSVATFAQNKTMINTLPGKQVSGHVKGNYATIKGNTALTNASKTTSGPGSAWFNILDYNELISPGVQTLSNMNLFPDSSIILGFTSQNEAVYAWIHKAGIYMDPSFMAQQSFINDKTATYNLDSVSVGYSYLRASASNITDSLIIQVIAENTNLNYTLSGPPQVSYQDILYNYSSNAVQVGAGANGMTLLKRIAIPLTELDSTNAYKQLQVATPGIAAQTNSKKIGAVVSFKPGYTYTIADTLMGSHRTNVFYMWSSEQQGDAGGTGTDPVYYGTANDFNSDMNMSYILPQDIRYNINANGWNGYFIPTYAYTTPFAFENHDIGFKITVPTPTSVKELEKNGFALGQNEPNPFNGTSTVKYQLSSDITVATLTVTDITGRIVSKQSIDGTKGNHSVVLSGYTSGVYYYTINLDGKTSTKKMIVE